MKKKVKRGDLQPGDVVSFELRPDRFGYGVVVSRIKIGHVAELFNYFTTTPEMPDSLADEAKLFPPVILDANSLLEKGVEGNWGRVGSLENYIPGDEVRRFKFTCGIKGGYYTTDIHNVNEDASDGEAARWPECSPWGDWDIKNYLKQQGVDL